MYKYAGTENQKTAHNKLPIELFTTAELAEELAKRGAALVTEQSEGSLVRQKMEEQLELLEEYQLDFVEDGRVLLDYSHAIICLAREIEDYDIELRSRREAVT